MKFLLSVLIPIILYIVGFTAMDSLGFGRQILVALCFGVGAFFQFVVSDLDKTKN